MSTPEFTTQIDPQYVTRRETLGKTFPEAARFLVGLEALCTSDPKFHLGTQKNVHIYYEDKFLGYITIEHLTKPTPFLRFSPEPNAQQVKEGTHQGSEVLVPRPLDHMIMDNGGYRAKWAAYERNKVLIDIKQGAPDTFFNQLLELIRRVGPTA
jgi:hypothetical protein